MTTSEELPKFVCDMGFSSAKWMFGKKKGRVRTVYKEHGEGLLIGEAALDSPGGVAFIRTADHLVKYYPAFLEKCLDEAGVKKPVSVAVGLPVQYWVDQGKIREKAAKEHRPSTDKITELERTLLSDRVKKVVVLPQGLGGIRSYLATEGGTKTGLILGVDFGWNTLIYTLYDPQRSPGDAVTSTTTHYKRGISQMVSHYLRPKIVDWVSGLAMTDVEVSEILESGFIRVGTDRHDIRPEIKAAAYEYASHILPEIVEDIKGDIRASRHMDTILFFGGGATYIENVITQRDVEVKVLPEPEFANARGFMSFLEG